MTSARDNTLKRPPANRQYRPYAGFGFLDARGEGATGDTGGEKVDTKKGQQSLAYLAIG